MARLLCILISLLCIPAVAAAAELSACLEGLAAHARGDYDGAIARYTDCIAGGNLTGHDLALAYNNRGVSFAAKGNFADALKDFDSTVRIEPDFAPVYRNRGYAYRSLGRYQLAFQNFDRAIELDPDFAVAYNDRGNAYKDLGQYQNAIRDYDEAIKRDPGYGFAAFNRCWTLAKHLGRYDEALPDCLKAAEILDREAYTAHGLGYVYEQQGDVERAKAAYERALDIDPLYAPAVADLKRLQGVSVN